MSDSQRIISIRKFYNLNQTEFAKTIGTVQSKISVVEKGKQALSLEMAGMIVEQFRVSAEWLMGKIGHDNSIMFAGDFVHKEELEQERREKNKLMEELLIYKSRELEQIKADRAMPVNQ